jgi:hypothetical protein
VDYSWSELSLPKNDNKTYKEMGKIPDNDLERSVHQDAESRLFLPFVLDRGILVWSQHFGGRYVGSSSKNRVAVVVVIQVVKTAPRYPCHPLVFSFAL